MRLSVRVLPPIMLVIAACSTTPSSTGEVASLPAPTTFPVTTAGPTEIVSPSPSISASPATKPVRSWSRLASGDHDPRAREDHTWTLDPETGQAYLFGGRDGGRVLGDLWRYDLTTEKWARITIDGGAPAARFGHTGTWVPGVGLVIWSGQAGSDFFNDAWAYEPAAGRWRRLPTNGAVPKARYGSCAALGPDGRLWISHGFTEDAGRFADTWAYDFDRHRWFDETPTGRVATIRCLHDCLWTSDGRFLIYAGQTTGAPAIGDLWSRAIDTDWSRIPDVLPPARQLYALAVGSERAYIFGGGDKDRSKLADLWSLELSTLTWREEAPEGRPPSARSGATMVADPSGSRILMFGGQTKSGALNDLWELSLAG